MAIIPMRTISDVELHIFPNCGHWVMIEQIAGTIAFAASADGGYLTGANIRVDGGSGA